MIHPTLTAQHSTAFLSPQAALSWQSAVPHGLPTVWVDSSRRFQTVLGFGAAFTEAAAVTWQALPAQQQREFMQACFSRDDGHGYTLCRVHMNSCDFALGNYAHVEREDDFALESFSMARDEQALLPMIKAAQEVARASGQEIRLLASPWSPPAWMKTTGVMNHGGELREDCRAAWAQCYVRFIQAYAAHGVPIWGVTVQNEPEALQRWDSCLYSAEQERDFVRDHLGPALQAAGLGHVRIIVWDHNRDRMVERVSVVLSDAAAARYVWGCGFHWYGEDHFNHVQLVHDAWPDKHLLFTEGCQEGGPHHGSWALGERYAKSMIEDMNRWTEGWIDWNLLLNEEGGPNHVGNLCSAPLMADRATGQLIRQNSYAYIGHFSRFVRPGAQRVLCAASRERLEVIAFRHPDGSVALIALNRSEDALPFAIGSAQGWASTELPARSIATYCW
ncbi:glycoside hydrolase family 30 protein [Ideonella paludis]|uniref:Glycoside hydrolase family 30 protein n=1 Tax=Ideonella paludis TaxID=1233411 RepID=A0ABS5DYV2_9BURK|nr:glycoside hydrolase family 30 protein [Ideonella paludis]MBQ0936006.1 glycoside hydrolase family 30 protein [Ideonella paludis]